MAERIELTNVDYAEILKTNQKILDLVTDERKLISFNSKEHQFGTIKTYLWLNVTIAAAFIGLINEAYNNHILSIVVAVVLLTCLLPVISGLLIGIIGLSQSLMKSHTSLPIENYGFVADDSVNYIDAKSKNIQLRAVIDGYQITLKEEINLMDQRAKLLHWQCRLALISLVTLSVAGLWIIILLI